MVLKGVAKATPFSYKKNPQHSWGVRLKATPYTKAVRQDGFSRNKYAHEYT